VRKASSSRVQTRRSCSTQVRNGRRWSQPIIRLPKGERALLTFTNLLESTCSRRCVSSASNGVELFVERLGKIINVNREGQLGMKAVLNDSLARVEYDKREEERVELRAQGTLDLDWIPADADVSGRGWAPFGPHAPTRTAALDRLEVSWYFNLVSMLPRATAVLTLIITTIFGCRGAGSTRADTARPSRAKGDFDPKGVTAALRAATEQAQSCEKAEGPHVLKIALRYENSGQIALAEIKPTPSVASDDAALRAVAIEVQKCVEDIFRKAEVAPFDGSPVTIRTRVVMRYTDGTLPEVPTEDSPKPPGEGAEARKPFPLPSDYPIADTCILNVNSIPHAPVVLDDVAIGVTPQVGIRVATGHHEIRFVKPNGGMKALRAVCAAGQTKVIATRLE
jgi:hypothetical protein